MDAHEAVPPPGAERFLLSTTRERWLEFLPLEHATLPLPADFTREGEEFCVWRAPIAGRRISAGRIPKEHGTGLLLQAAAVVSVLQSAGFWLDETDLTEALWDCRGGVPRLWLTRTPAAVRRGGPGSPPSVVLAALLHRIFLRGRQIGPPAARTLFDRLLAPDAAFRRADFWLSSAYRLFPELSAPGAAGTRIRTVGSVGSFLRSAPTRALVEKARALLTNRSARVFTADSSALTPGGALGFEGCPASVASAVRQLRERHERDSSGRRAVWIAVEPERWDALSRHAFEAAACRLGGEVETIAIPATAPPPRLPDEWRREILVPGGTLTASLRFYEALAERAHADPACARSLVEGIVSSAQWGAFVSDATGGAPLPVAGAASTPSEEPGERRGGERELLELLSVLDTPFTSAELARFFPRRRNLSRLLGGLESRGELVREPGGRWRLPERSRPRLSASRRRELCRRCARAEPDPGRRIEFLLAAGDVEEALEEGERWLRGSGTESLERWLGVSCRLASAAGGSLPAWLETLEAERELAGGRPEEAAERLRRVAESSGASAPERRAALLRLAEVCGLCGRRAEAGRRAAAWRGQFPDAPPAERVRALRVEAATRAREGEHEAALDLLSEADRIGGALPTAARVETALERADVYSLAGRFREEKETYERWRALVLEEQDDSLTARLLSREALGLCDRRDFAAAVARLEEALAVMRDDPVERARILLDLATTLYHAGRPDRCASLLDEAIALAGAAGREDLVRTARGNRLEIAINRGNWDSASEEIEALLTSAREEGDSLRILVALHHRSRLALRRGHLESAARDNAEARSLAERLADRLEVGELWLEEGDRLLYGSDLEAAREAYQAAAAQPPDRSHGELRARERLRELDWRSAGGPPESAWSDLDLLFGRDEYTAAEAAARWRVLFGEAPPDGPAAELVRRGERVLRARGGSALADRVFGRKQVSGTVPSDALASLRAAVAGALAGDEREAPLPALGLSGLAITDGRGQPTLSLGQPAAGSSVSRRLEAGAATYELSLWPAVSEETADAIGWTLETLLFRFLPPAPPSDFAAGWRRLNVIAADSSMEEPYRRLVRFAPQPVTVLVLGESGCGKEAVARAVHALSPRTLRPFVAVNISAIPPALLESELFGHARGSFTGADRDRSGLYEEAAGGTIFFDEVGDLSPPLQAKLLRALQEREIRRVGENRPRPVDVRVVSATSRDLAREVEAGRFREDLYYRLHVAVIRLPPLRERGRDTLLLARQFLSRYAREYGRGDLQFAPEALAALSAHGWPGNVRELQNAVAQAAALAESNGVVSPVLLPESVRRERRSLGPSEDYRSRVDAHRRGLITEALERAGGNRSRAARDLGLSRQALLYLIRELQVSPRPRPGH
jgi:transcriptional regulator with AAA-type ATPase domain